MALFSLKNNRVHLKGERNTAGQNIVPIALPREVHISMKQGQCDPAEPVAAAGDSVRVGQLIGRSPSPLSVPVHSSVSGTVKAVVPEPSQNGSFEMHIVIECDGRQDFADSVVPPVIESTKDFINAVQASGVVGLGGAGFPMAAKFAPCVDAQVDTLIINGAECEPFLTVDRMTMTAHSRDVISGSEAIMKWLGIKHCIIGVNRSMREVYENFEDLLKGRQDFVLRYVPDLYPVGAEHIIIRELTGRTLLPGRIPPDVGCLVCNVNSVVKLQHYLATGLPLVTKNLTVDGSAVSARRNIEVPIGTLISDIFEFCGGPAEGTEPVLILLDGVMMGHAVPNSGMPITGSNNTVLFFDEDFASRLEPTACINCGRCIRSCPQNLMPGRIFDAVQKLNTSFIEKSGAENCINCGACSYVCPARRRLSASVYGLALSMKGAKKNE